MSKQMKQETKEKIIEGEFEKTIRDWLLYLANYASKWGIEKTYKETAKAILELFAQEKQKTIDNCLREHSFKCCQLLREAKEKWVEETEYLPTKLRFVIRGIYPESVWKTPPKAKRPHDAGAAYIMRILGANVAKNELEKLLRELKQRLEKK